MPYVFTGTNSNAITRLDMLDTLPRVKICTDYKVNGKTISDFPASVATLEKCQSVLEDMPGWQASTAKTRVFGELPNRAKKYITRLEELIGCPVSMISVGERREQTIVRRSLF